MLPPTVEDRLQFLRRGWAFVQSYALGQGTADEYPSEDAWAGLAEYCDLMVKHVDALETPLLEVLGEEAPDLRETDEEDDDSEDNGAGDDESDDDNDNVMPTRDQPKPRRLRGGGARGGGK